METKITFERNRDEMQHKQKGLERIYGQGRTRMSGKLARGEIHEESISTSSLCQEKTWKPK